MGITIIILALISIGFLIYKAYIRKEWGLMTAVLSRVYLLVIFGVATYDKIDFFANSIRTIFVFPIIAILASDIIVNISYLASKKFLKAMELDRLTRLLGILETKYYCLLESSQAGVYVIDSDGDFEYVNSALCRMSGYSKSELLKMSVLDLVTDEYKPLVKEEIKERIHGKKPTAAYDVMAVDRFGNKKKIHIVSSRTENGHPTITGNVLEV